MVDTENFKFGSKPKSTKKITKVGRKTKVNSNASFTIVYKKLAAVKAPTKRNVDVGKTYTQTGCGDGDVLRYVRDEYITELEEENKKLRLKVGVQLNSINSKEKHIKAAQNEKKILKNELRTLRSKAYEKNVIRSHLEQHCTTAQASKLMKPEKKYYRKFTDDDMKLAAQLRSMSREAYHLVRQKSILCIPGNKTLNTWLKDHPEFKVESHNESNSAIQKQLETGNLNYNNSIVDNNIKNPILKKFLYKKPMKIDVNVKSDLSDSILQLKKKSFYQTIDYFDTELGVLNNKESPSLSDFAISLLREILLELGQSNKLYPKLRLGTFLLHLGTRATEFSGLYNYYKLIEREAGKENISWTDFKLISSIQELILTRCLSGDFSFDRSILPSQLLHDDEVIFEDEGDSNFLLTIVDEQYGDDILIKHDQHLVPHLLTTEAPNTSSAYDENVQVKSNDLLQSDDNNEKRLPMDVVNFESNEPEPNAFENNEPERNAAESMVLLTSRSTQHRLKSKHEDVLLNHFEETTLDQSTKKEPNKKRKSSKKTVHTDLIDGVDDGVCPTCNESVKSFDELDRHMFLNHNLGVLCQQCGLASDSYETYKEHSKIHTFECQICSQNFMGIEDFRKHNWYLHNPVKCDTCNKLFMNRVRLKRHKSSCFAKDDCISEFKCALCSFKSKTKRTFSDHISKVHTETLTSTSATKEVHNYSISPEKLSNTAQIKLTNFYQCAFCDQIFGCSDALKTHSLAKH